MAHFTDGKQAGDVLATAKLHLTGTGWDDQKIDEYVNATLEVSGAFQYGNQTCMAFEWENGNVESFDTRYEHVTPDTFAEFARRVLDDRTMKTVQVEIA